MKVSGLLVFACAAALSAGCNGHKQTDTSIANSTTNAPAPADTTGTAGIGVSNSDTKFVNEQLAGGTAEIELAKMAMEQASSPEVKQFAQMMINDHTRAGDELKELASTNAIPERPENNADDQKLMDRLSKLHGADFDKAYMSAMVEDHEKDVSAVRARVDEDRSVTDKLKGKNPESPAAVTPKTSDDRVTMSINQWAADTLPTLEYHLDRAEAINSSLGHS